MIREEGVGGIFLTKTKYAIRCDFKRSCPSQLYDKPEFKINGTSKDVSHQIAKLGKFISYCSKCYIKFTKNPENYKDRNYSGRLTGYECCLCNQLLDFSDHHEFNKHAKLICKIHNQAILSNPASLHYFGEEKKPNTWSQCDCKTLRVIDKNNNISYYTGGKGKLSSVPACIDSYPKKGQHQTCLLSSPDKSSCGSSDIAKRTERITLDDQYFAEEQHYPKDADNQHQYIMVMNLIKNKNEVKKLTPKELKETIKPYNIWAMTSEEVAKKRCGYWLMWCKNCGCIDRIHPLWWMEIEGNDKSIIDLEIKKEAAEGPKWLADLRAKE
jgi:hypothetical protein